MSLPESLLEHLQTNYEGKLVMVASLTETQQDLFNNLRETLTAEGADFEEVDSYLLRVPTTVHTLEDAIKKIEAEGLSYDPLKVYFWENGTVQEV